MFLANLLSVIIPKKWQLSMVLIEVIICHNFAKHEADFIIFSVIIRNDLSNKICSRVSHHIYLFIYLLTLVLNSTPV